MLKWHHCQILLIPFTCIVCGESVLIAVWYEDIKYAVHFVMQQGLKELKVSKFAEWQMKTFTEYKLSAPYQRWTNIRFKHNTLKVNVAPSLSEITWSIGFIWGMLSNDFNMSFEIY